MKLLKTTAAGILMMLVLASCEKDASCDGSISKTFNNTGFSRITAGSVMHVHIQQADTFSIKATGCSRDINDLRVRQRDNGVLEIDFDRNLKRRDQVDIDITLPQLIAGNFSGASEAAISGFAGGTTNMRIVLSGASKAKVEGTTLQTQIDLSGASELDLSGNTNLLTGNISGASELNAFSATASEVDISASGGSKAYVFAQNMLRAEASGGSTIRYRGNPQVKEIVTSGGGKVTND